MHMKTLRINLLLPLSVLLCSSCRPGAAPELSPRTVLAVPAALLADSFSLAVASGVPYVAYTDRESLALVLTAAEPAAGTDYLDRITSIPENDSLLGSQIMLGGSQLHLFYLDRRSEEAPLLKYVRKDPATGNSWLDVLPAPGKPVAALLGDRGEFELFLEMDQGLYWQRYPSSAPPSLLAAPFASGGPAAVLGSQADPAGFRGFTVFDLLSQRLLLFRQQGAEVVATTIARFGRVHGSIFAADGTVQVLAYDPRSLRIVLFQAEAPTADFRSQPVTLSRGTSSLALVNFAGRTAFLFNELEASEAGPYLISVLVPVRQGGYRKLTLHRSANPLGSFRTAQTADSLYVAFQEGTLRVLRLELVELSD